MKRTTIFVATFAIMLATAHAIEDQAVVVKKQDVEMLEAIGAARAGLDDFLSKHETPPQGTSQFRLKVKFAIGNTVEHMWVSPFKNFGDKFVGILADEPEYAKTLTNGQRVTFSREDISDWGYVQDGKQRGGFTVCVLFKRMPQQEVKKYREQYGFEC